MTLKYSLILVRSVIQSVESLICTVWYLYMVFECIVKSNLVGFSGFLCISTDSLLQAYPADFSNYGPMYQSYYAKQAQQAMATQQARSSPYQRNMYSPNSACYQGAPGPVYQTPGAPGPPTVYPRQYDYPMHTPR